MYMHMWCFCKCSVVKNTVMSICICICDCSENISRLISFLSQGMGGPPCYHSLLNQLLWTSSCIGSSCDDQNRQGIWKLGPSLLPECEAEIGNHQYQQEIFNSTLLYVCDILPLTLLLAPLQYASGVRSLCYVTKHWVNPGKQGLQKFLDAETLQQSISSKHM